MTEEISTTYNDFDTQEVFYRTALESTTNNSAIDVEYTVDPLEQLDRNQIAEIVAVDITHNFGIRDNRDNSNLSSGRFDYSVNVNRFTGRDLDGRNTSVDVVDQNNTGPATATNIQTDVNTTCLDRGNIEATAGFSSANNGFGGPGSSGTAARNVVDFRDLLGGGPVIDRFDDLVLRHSIKTDNFAGISTGESQGMIYFATDQEANERGTSF